MKFMMRNACGVKCSPSCAAHVTFCTQVCGCKTRRGGDLQSRGELVHQRRGAEGAGSEGGEVADGVGRSTRTADVFAAGQSELRRRIQAHNSGSKLKLWFQTRATRTCLEGTTGCPAPPGAQAAKPVKRLRSSLRNRRVTYLQCRGLQSAHVRNCMAQVPALHLRAWATTTLHP